ncbi:hypothetical protein ACFFWD_15115 [Bradyrhizobium erythrophlei]|uniref:hypothetical protein n=1 Tax=Bradyrhizobium erythrophlei TaxID=1437360 RepID=UPI0035F0C44A
MIVFASGPCYPVLSMKWQLSHRRRLFAPALRGMLTVCLTLAYVIVGVAGEIVCAEETLASVEQAEQVELAAMPGKADQDSKKPAVTVVDHCYTCVPLLLPPPVLVAEPTSKSAPPTYATPTFLLEDHPGLDTPPPKYRI